MSQQGQDGDQPRQERSGGPPGEAPPTGSESDQPRWLSREEQRAWRAFLDANRLLTDAIDQELQRDSGIPHTYYEILVRLSEAPDHRLRMSELADAATASRSRMSHAVARLEGLGWVRRDECPTDRRGQVAALTDEGFAALEAAAPGHAACVRDSLFDRITPDQVTALREISEAVVRHLSHGSRPGEPNRPVLTSEPGDGSGGPRQPLAETLE